MTAQTLWYDPVDSEFNAFVLVDQIAYVDKFTEEITAIHLLNGTVLYSKDSMKTLSARIEKGGEE